MPSTGEDLALQEQDPFSSAWAHGLPEERGAATLEAPPGVPGTLPSRKPAPLSFPNLLRTRCCRRNLAQSTGDGGYQINPPARQHHDNIVRRSKRDWVIVRPVLAPEHRRLVEKGVVVDLLDEEVRHVGARDKSACPVAGADV